MMARVLLIEDSPLQRWMLCRQLRALGHEPLPVDCCAQALARVTGGTGENASVEPGGSARAADVALVALPLSQDNGFQCGMLLREAGVGPVLLLADVPRATDAWWARSLGLGTADGAWTVLLRPVALQTLAHALTAALEETRHGQPA
jgi:CheY-like chemotaxis protein